MIKTLTELLNEKGYLLTDNEYPNKIWSSSLGVYLPCKYGNEFESRLNEHQCQHICLKHHLIDKYNTIISCDNINFTMNESLLNLSNGLDVNLKFNDKKLQFCYENLKYEKEEILLVLNKKQQKLFAKMMIENIVKHYGINSNLPDNKQINKESEEGIFNEIKKLTGDNIKHANNFEEILEFVLKK